MSKSSQSTNFRKVNVDDLDEDRFQDDTTALEESVGPSESDVQGLLNRYEHINLNPNFELCN